MSKLPEMRRQLKRLQRMVEELVDEPAEPEHNQSSKDAA
jgi:hypothetical protein